MHKIFFYIIVFLAPFCANAQTAGPDMTVFGYKLGEPLHIPECKCEIQSYLGSSRFHKKEYYLYVDNTKIVADCFERRDLAKYDPKKDHSMPEVVNGFVDIYFAKDSIPDMCATYSFVAGILDGKLIGITFNIRSEEASKDLQQLKNKYGNDVTVKNYQMQNGYGATRNYFVATWSLPGLAITLSSADVTTLSSPYGTVTIAIPQKTESNQNGRKL